MEMRQEAVRQPHEKAPTRNPITAVSQGVCPISSAIWMPGASSDQKLAAI